MEENKEKEDKTSEEIKTDEEKIVKEEENAKSSDETKNTAEEKTENIENKETRKDSEDKKSDNNDVKEENNEEYVPEQLEDDDFEKEKNKAKEEKKQKKLEKKAKKENKKIKYDENGNPIQKGKKSKIKLIIIILLLLIVIIGIVAYFVISLNQPQNVVQDFAIYFNNEDWDNLANCVDMRGFLTLSLIDTEASSDDEEESTDEETNESSEETTVSYMDYDSRYETIYEDIEVAGYDETVEIIEYGEENNSEILSTMFDGYALTIESIKSTDKIENTESLYKITYLCTMDVDGESSTDTYTAYVSKVDGTYKIVGGDFPYLIYTAYIYYQYYFSYSY